MAKKQKEESTDSNSELVNNYSIVEKAILKEFGDVLLPASVLKEFHGEMLPTTLSLDLALNGGIPEGCVVSIAGVASSGKTTLCLTIIAAAQKQGRRCYYIDVEGKIQISLLKTIPGLDVEKLQLIRSNNERFLTAEDYLNIAEQIISSEPRALIVFDSVAALCVAASHESKTGEGVKMMGLPSLMYTSLRKTAQRLASMHSNIIFVTHLQANPSPYGGGPTAVGGNAITYFSTVTLKCLSSKEVPKEGETKTGRESVFKILKSGLGPGTGNATLYIKYHHGYDRLSDIFNLASELGYIAKGGAWYSFEDQSGELIKLQGESGVIAYLKENSEFADILEQKIRDSVLNINRDKE